MITRKDVKDMMYALEVEIEVLAEESDTLDSMSDRYTVLLMEIQHLDKKLKKLEDAYDELRYSEALSEEEFRDYCKSELEEHFDNLECDIKEYLDLNYDSYCSDRSSDFSVIEIDGDEYYLV
jgi:hypothetical protein